MSYQDYLDGLRDGFRIGFKDGLKKGFIIGQNLKYVQRNRDGYEDISLGPPYKCREQLDEVKFKIPAIDPLPLLKDKIDPVLSNYDPPKINFEPLPYYEFEPALSRYNLLKKLE
jgi:hypothetical protein